MENKYVENVGHVCVPKRVYILPIFTGEDHDIRV